MVEFAIVTPVVFVLMFGLLIGGMGVSRFEQIAPTLTATSWSVLMRGRALEPVGSSIGMGCVSGRRTGPTVAGHKRFGKPP